MFSLFFTGLQQDFKLFLLAPAVCALFRMIFILVYRPQKSFSGEGHKLFTCFRYGFWWGMDFNAYVFLFSMLLVTVPGAFFPVYHAVGDMVRVIGIDFYMAVLYTAFAGKMIFYYHYHDIYNHILWLGKKADKNNLADIFFHQNHGGWILLGYLPFLCLTTLAAQVLLGLPVFVYPFHAWGDGARYAVNTLLVLFAGAFFYFCRFGGTFRHASKPEWDEVPAIVKQDIFLAKATLDDLVALEIVWKHPMNELLKHTDVQAVPVMASVMPMPAEAWKNLPSPLAAFRHKAQGARIKPPKHIFFLVGESYAQAPFDAIYENLHLVDGGKAFRADPHTFTLQNFLPAGEISQPALVSMMTGMYDAGLELNEREDFWRGSMVTSLPRQLQALGYKTVFWYGGSLSWGSLNHFVPAVGFDEAMDAMKFCPADAPRTWLGIYDHIFLENAARIIKESQDDRPVFHFLYTTSNHGPYKMPLAELGYDVEKVMPEAPLKARQDAMAQRRMGVYWYTDQALSAFIRDMQQTYEDSLIVVTGDHAMGIIPFDCGVVDREGPTIREQVCTSFAMYHRELSSAMFVPNTIGEQMNIMPTLLELLAPRGHEYYSLFPSLFEPISHITTPYHWMTPEAVGRHADPFAQPLTVTPRELPMQTMDANPYLAEMHGWCEITAWMARHPELLDRIDIGQ